VNALDHDNREKDDIASQSDAANHQKSERARQLSQDPPPV
jgi:hypothetical protein